MDRIVLISGHYLLSRRQAGFHWIARSFRDMGADVLFITAPISWLSWLRRDHRFQYPVRREANQIVEVADGLRSYVWMTPWHPANLRSRVLNRMADPLFCRYSGLELAGIEDSIREADVVIFESTPALLLYRRFRELAPKARFIYRVSDDLSLLRNHPRVLAAEAEFAPEFDLVSVPSDALRMRFQTLTNVALHPHGIQRSLFDVPVESPFSGRFAADIVFVGNSHFDRTFLEISSRERPDFGFHIIGPIPGLPRASNIFAYGELPFAETVPFIRSASAGMQTVRYRPGIESLSDSLKVIQYSYCRLPILVPTFIRSDRPNFIYYEAGNAPSIRSALDAVVHHDVASVDTSGIISWDELAQMLVHDQSGCCTRSPVVLPNGT